MNYLNELYLAWMTWRDGNSNVAIASDEGCDQHRRLCTGWVLTEEQEGWSEWNPAKHAEFEEGACYFCATYHEMPQKITSFNELLELERVALDFSIDGRDICFGNTKDTCTLEELYEAREKIKAEIEDWRGEHLDTENNTYSGQVNVGHGKVIAFEMAAELEEDKLFFDDSIYLKRVR